VSRFRKRPVVIEAVQWDGHNLGELLELQGEVEVMIFIDRGNQIVIETLEGQMRGEVGCWVIKGVEGELYPCKAEIFEKTYEAVDMCNQQESDQ